jgi:hypothetical protein
MKLRILVPAALMAAGLALSAAAPAEAMRAVPRWACPPGWHPGPHGWDCFPNHRWHGHWYHAWHGHWHGWHGHSHWHHHGHWHGHHHHH